MLELESWGEGGVRMRAIIIIDYIPFRGTVCDEHGDSGDWFRESK